MGKNDGGLGSSCKRMSLFLSGVSIGHTGVPHCTPKSSESRDNFSVNYFQNMDRNTSVVRSVYVRISTSYIGT